MIIQNVIDYLKNRFPESDAEDFDRERIGFIIGSKTNEVTNIMLSLDLNMEVVDEAIEKNCNLIITHHPFIWDPLYKLDYDNPKIKVILKMIKHDIALYSMHTNLDVASGGVNDTLSEVLGLQNIKSLYDENKGNFLRYGEITPTTLLEFAKNVKLAFGLTGVRVMGDLNKEIVNVGVLGGAGGGISEINEALECHLDCYITGEIRLSNSQYADMYGLSLIEVNHGVEKLVFTSLIEELRKEFTELYNYRNKIYITKYETDKFITIS